MKTKLLENLAVLLAASLTSTVMSSTALAQAFPNKPVRIIVQVAPGGGADVTARAMAKVLAGRIGQNVLVENRTGANGAIGVDAVVKSPPDGYTIGAVTSGFAISASTEKTLPYNPRKDVVPLLLYGDQPLVLIVNAGVPASNAQELLQLARSKPGILTFGVSDPSTILATDMLRRGMKADIVSVDYKGSGPMMIDILGGQITGTLTSFASAGQHIASGKVRAIAVTTMTRASQAPALPTLNESIAPGYELTSWYAMVAPAATPKDVLLILNRELSAAAQSQEISELFARMQLRPIAEPLDKVQERMTREFNNWEAIVKAATPRT